MRTRKTFGDKAGQTLFAVVVAAILTAATAGRVAADESPIFAAGQGFEVASPGTGPYVSPPPQGTFLAKGSGVRTGKTGWAILRLGNDTQVELHADSEVALYPSSHTGSAAVEVELRRGALAALADGETELRVRFADGVTTAKHARFAVEAGRGEHARVIVERGVARVFVGSAKEPVLPAAGQFVDIGKPAAGNVAAAVQPVRGNDTEAVAEMAALRFVPALVEPAAKPPTALADNATANPPAAVAPATADVAAAAAAVNDVPASQSASAAAPAFLPPPADRSSVTQPGVVATATYDAAPLSSLVNVDPLQAPANGANTTGPIVSPDHP